MLHSGIDLHKRDLAVVTVDDGGALVRRQRLPAGPAAVAGYFRALAASHGGPQRAVVESTATWYGLGDLLRAEQIPRTLGHAKAIKAISSAKVKTDAADARTLAQLLRAALVPEAHMVSPELREARDLLRARLRLVAKAARAKNAFAALLAQYNAGAADEWPALAQLQADLLAEEAAFLAAQRKRIERRRTPLLAPTPEVQRLLAIPGVGRLTAFTIYLEVDTIARFPDAKHFASYCRLVPGAANSGGEERHKRVRDGNRSLKLACSHAAVRAIQYYPEVRAFYEETARRTPRVVARALVAKELGRAAYFVLARAEAFHGTFRGKRLSRTKRLNQAPPDAWHAALPPRSADPAASLEPQHATHCAPGAAPPPMNGAPSATPPRVSGTARRPACRARNGGWVPRGHAASGARDATTAHGARP